ncbi:hypothetical protein ACKC5O_05090 [Aeromonas schubertii]|uniref:Uncharacterized protein n=1 Tax=Aeromonas schubertii TaxID=652 RepID=A0ABS7V8T0_9GAMM|nr:hypothetical protein [Aeromonas schubertii]MBZ6065800.1 hypothetical protein [Aeromonas schubertii]QCG48195.1 hypothetical protein E2P79_10350 [Aeromonas schubertii]
MKTLKQSILDAYAAIDSNRCSVNPRIKQRAESDRKLLIRFENECQELCSGNLEQTQDALMAQLPDERKNRVQEIISWIKTNPFISISWSA